MTPPKPAGITTRDWRRTPIAVRRYVEALELRVAALEARVAFLEALLRRDSTTSSRPPSSDPPTTRRRRTTRPPSGRRPGGQPGHRGHHRARQPAARVDAWRALRPAHCRACAAPLGGDDLDPHCHQVVELPVARALVTEYQRHALTCRDCGVVTRAALPRGVDDHALGPRATAVVALLTGAYHLSRRTTTEVLGALFDVPLALGSVVACEATVSAALAAPVALVQAALERQPVLHVDETGWRVGRRRAWLWVAAAPQMAVFWIAPHRDRAAMAAGLGGFAGVLVSDRWRAYQAWPPHRRQICWAHLRRDFQALAESTDPFRALGAALLAHEEALFRSWHRVRDGTQSRAAFARQAAYRRRAMTALLRRGARHVGAPQAGVCREILGAFASAWTFVRVRGVEPTNNHAERVLRRAVLWRKNSFGTRSAAGSRYVERMLTATQTLRLQHRSVVAYLTELVVAARAGATRPSLLPAAAPARRQAA